MKYKKGEWYEIVFWDHCEGKDRYKVQVILNFVEEDDTFLYLSYWNSLHKDEETVKLNHGYISLVKSAVVSAHQIVF